MLPRPNWTTSKVGRWVGLCVSGWVCVGVGVGGCKTAAGKEVRDGKR